LKQFELILVALKKNEAEGKKTGVVSMIRPDGRQPLDCEASGWTQ
jgi:hypothetical protein